MSQPLPKLYLARHGDTAWTVSGQHTGLTDIPLTPEGEKHALQLGERLKGLTFRRVFTSPLQRASKTAQLAGYGAALEVDADLVEWNYGDYEGRTSTDIHKERPDWNLFRDGCPNGETLAQIGTRADRFITKVRAIDADVLIFTSGHIGRVIGARWLGLDPGFGRYWVLSTATLSILGYEHNKNEPVLRLWNGASHVHE